MGVTAGTVQTYSNTVMFEDLANAYKLLSPTECPFQAAIGTGSTATTHFDWPIVDLAAVDSANRVIEGEDAPAIDTATMAKRVSNYTQISDKQVSVSSTSEAIDAAAENLQKMAKQMAIKLKEMKRDIETMLLSNVPAIVGASGTARQTAGLPAWITSNVSMGASGANPTLSGGTSGYPNAAATAGTTRAFTEILFNDVIQSAWTNGGDPSLALMNANNKRVLSQNFTGNATRYKDNMDKKVLNAVDFYESDFGTVTCVPTRFLPTIAANNYIVLLIDSTMASVEYLDPVQEKPLAETGHSKKRLLWAEYALKVDNQAAHGIVRDLNGS